MRKFKHGYLLLSAIFILLSCEQDYDINYEDSMILDIESSVNLRKQFSTARTFYVDSVQVVSSAEGTAFDNDIVLSHAFYEEARNTIVEILKDKGYTEVTDPLEDESPDIFVFNVSRTVRHKNMEQEPPSFSSKWAKWWSDWYPSYPWYPSLGTYPINAGYFSMVITDTRLGSRSDSQGVIWDAIVDGQLESPKRTGDYERRVLENITKAFEESPYIQSSSSQDS
ncbi:MAG: DUF4136 domain-containing protein [Bacteroidales bacterium]